jgi:hypothetical protein
MIDNLKARLRQAAVWPIYLISLILDFASAALGRLAACVAGDDWARPDYRHITAKQGRAGYPR